MLIEEKKLQYWIDNFYGYGSWSAPFWFIGYEESGGDVPEEVADKINYFQKEHPVPGELCDLRDLYRHVAIRWEGPKSEKFKNRFEFRFGPEAVQHGVWKNLIKLIHGYKEKKLPDLIAYQKTSFVTKSKPDAALIPFYPLPSPHGHSWYYSWLDITSMQFLKTRSQYEDHVYAHRIRTIMEMIARHKPEIVLMYGMNNINTLKASVQEFMPGARFTMVKAEKLVTPQYHRAELGDTKLLITTQIPALRHNRVETGFDWEEFGRKLRPTT